MSNTSNEDSPQTTSSVSSYVSTEHRLGVCCDPDTLSGTATSVPLTSPRRVAAAPARTERPTTTDIRAACRRPLPLCRARAPGRPVRTRSCRCAARRSRDHIRYRGCARRTRSCRPRGRSAARAARRWRSRVLQTWSSPRWRWTARDAAVDSCSCTVTPAHHSSDWTRYTAGYQRYQGGSVTSAGSVQKYANAELQNDFCSFRRVSWLLTPCLNC